MNLYRYHFDINPKRYISISIGIDMVNDWHNVIGIGMIILVELYAVGKDEDNKKQLLRF